MYVNVNADHPFAFWVIAEVSSDITVVPFVTVPAADNFTSSAPTATVTKSVAPVFPWNTLIIANFIPPVVVNTSPAFNWNDSPLIVPSAVIY